VALLVALFITRMLCKSNISRVRTNVFFVSELDAMLCSFIDCLLLRPGTWRQRHLQWNVILDSKWMFARRESFGNECGF